MSDDWEGCYPSQWKGLIVEDAIVHPAKFSSKLIRRIYEHMLAEGWLKAGDVVIDPFGGVALGAMDAMRSGLRWRGCELEQRFVDLGNANIEFWNGKFAALPKWSGDAVLYQGDSRKLLEVLRKGGTASVSSPPYKTETQGNGLNVNKPATFRGVLKDGTLSMGESEGNLGNMPVREDSFRGAISSPPYAESMINPGNVDNEIKKNWGQGKSLGSHNKDGYGERAGQLGAMRARDENFQASVSSPPFEKTEGTHSAKKYADPEKVAEEMAQKYQDGTFKGHAASKEAILRSLQKSNEQTYGDTAGNIGNDSGDDFWLAARQIVEQVYLALEPGGHAVWVVKDFVKNKQRVPFSDQWRQLCEAVGFTTLHEHHALLVHRKGIQRTLDGKELEIKTESKSFFRRLAEKNGSPRIDYETVWCMLKPK